MWLFLILILHLQNILSTKTIDGLLDDWKPEELVYRDSFNDSPWGVLNEVHQLFISWDIGFLYIGVDGIQKDGNCLVIYIDTHSVIAPVNTGPEYTRGDLFQPTTWWWGKNHKFPKEFRPDFQINLYQMKLNINEGHGLYMFTSSITYKLITNIEQKSSGTGEPGKYGAAEFKIPWSIVYPGGIPKGAVLKLIVAMTGGTDVGKNKFGSAHDTIPDQIKPFTPEWYGEYEFDKWIEIKVDVNDDGIIDKEISPIPRNIKFFFEDENNGLRVIWKKREITETDAKFYQIEISTFYDFSSYFISSTTGNNILITGLSEDTTYYIRLRAIYEVRIASPSYTIMVPPLGPILINKTPKNFPYIDKKLNFFLETKNLQKIRNINLHYGNIIVSMSSTTTGFKCQIPSPYVPELSYYFSIETAYGKRRLPSNPTHYFRITFNPKITEKYQPYKETILKLDDYTKVTISPFSLEKEGYITFEYLGISDITGIPSGLEPYMYFKLISNDFSFFKKPAKLQLRYFEDVSFQNLAIYCWTGTSWSKLNTQINPHNKTLSTEITLLGQYAIFSGILVEEQITRLLEVTNPTFYPSKKEKIIFKFSGPENRISLSIFNLQGKEIYNKEFISTEQVYWDGADVEQGLYIYQIKLPNKTIYGSCVLMR